MLTWLIHKLDHCAAVREASIAGIKVETVYNLSLGVAEHGGGSRYSHETVYNLGVAEHEGESSESLESLEHTGCKGTH